jgi:hypothetical protein
MNTMKYLILTNNVFSLSYGVIFPFPAFDKVDSNLILRNFMFSFLNFSFVVRKLDTNLNSTTNWISDKLIRELIQLG